MPKRNTKELDKVMNETMLIEQPETQKSDDFLKELLDNKNRAVVLTEERQEDDMVVLNKLRRKYSNLSKLFPTHRFEVLGDSWSVATLKENIDKNKSIVLGNNETNHGEIHATVLQQTTDFVENTGNRYVNLDGLSNNIMGNSAIQNSSKMILGEFLDNFIVNSSTNCNKILIWNLFLELARTIFYNKIKERMSNKIDLMEERFAKNIQEVEKED